MTERFMFRSLLVALVAALALTAQTFAQPQPGGPPGPGGGFGFGGFGGPGGPGGGGVLGLALREDVQQELQLVDEQREKLRDLMEGARERMREEMQPLFAQMRDMRDASEDERREFFEKLRKKGEEMNAELEKDLGKVLLPNQMERLKQIDLQSRVRFNAPGDIARALNLSDEQREKLEARIAEIREETRIKIRELEAEAREKMLDVLTPEQRAQLKKLMGDEFEMRDGPGFGGRFGGQFGRGGGQDGQGRGGRFGRGDREGGRRPIENPERN